MTNKFIGDNCGMGGYIMEDKIIVISDVVFETGGG